MSLRYLLDLAGVALSMAATVAESQPGGGFFMPPAGSTSAPGVDRIFYFILAISVFFFLLIVSLMVFFVVRYRRRPGSEPLPSPTHNTALEVTWTTIPIVLVLVIFVWGFKVFMDLSTPPANSYEVLVTGQKWKWLFTYPNGTVDENLHAPVDTPVRLVMTSEDVIHGFFIPAFRLKHDVVPGRYAKVWFRAVKAGDYQIFCTQYCGTGHSDMLAKVVIHEPGGFESWLEDAGNFLKKMPPAQAGEKLYRVRGCAQCHTLDGTASTGPTFKGVWGRKETLKGMNPVVVDENYVRESILEPQAKIVAGFEPVMPTYKGRLKDQEITAIIEFLKTVK